MVTIYKFEFKEEVDGKHPFEAICRELKIPNPEKVESLTFESDEVTYEYG